MIFNDDRLKGYSASAVKFQGQTLEHVGIHMQMCYNQIYSVQTWDGEFTAKMELFIPIGLGIFFRIPVQVGFGSQKLTY